MFSSLINQRESVRSREEELALLQGKAYGHALRYMTEIEAIGTEKHVGDFIIGYTVQHAEGTYVSRDDHLIWEEPSGENAHIEIIVRSAVDGRFIPGLSVMVTVTDYERHILGTNHHPFLWHPWLYHYGRNWTIPKKGLYRITVKVKAPLEMMRHDRENALRFSDGAEVSFDDVEMPLYWR